ncbi:restriction endonuclease subunit S [Pectobacterium punjabense]|uniref:restriction endonuclease subunit S n=1 Tax=Pectobacterium punjabense TaxID=2108399 RepID=UPI0019696DAC|nr:restriction endonuclease subunit S [Pectobacterium punjabense]MBN3135841.1 restriction endonuclease subunit S [Pectobacterium punjabense]MCE5380819.1 restriction endonuclease subunit S [Pectobacterium punjabense]
MAELNKYKTYPEYKDSGVEWLGAIPAHWVCTVLKRLCLLVTGLTPPTNNEDNYADEGYPWIRPEDINENGPETQASKYVSDNGWKLLRHVEPNSTIICCIGTIGKCGYVREIVSTNQQITAATFRDSERFNFYLMQSARTQLEELATGNVLKILNSERLGTLNVVKVDGKEANIIAEFLDHETEKIDNLIEKQKQLIELLKEKRQAVISHAVTKGLNPNVPMKDSGVEWLGEVPEHWNVCRLKQIIKSGTSISYGIVQPGDYFDEGVPFIQTTNVSQGNIDLDSLQRTSEKIERHYPRSRLEGGEVILGIRASIGSAYVVPLELKGVNLSRGVARIQPGENITSDYLVWYFKTNAVEQYWALSKQGSTFSEVSIETVRELVVCVPPKDEQHRISSCLEGSLDKIHELIVKSEMQMSFLQERRTALISAAVTGKIDVRDWVAPANSEMANIEESPEVNA